MIEPEFLDQCASLYFNKAPQTELTSPIIGNTKGLPKMFLWTGGLEIFREDIRGSSFSKFTLLSIKK